MKLIQRATQSAAVVVALVLSACGAPTAPVSTEAPLHTRALPLADTALIAPPLATTAPTKSKNCFGGIPVCAEAVTFLVNRGYDVGYSEARKDPLWAAYTLRSDVDVHDVSRPKKKFQADGRVHSSAKDSDYDNSGFDRGHMAPSDAIGQWYGKTAQLGTFIVTNIVPQSPGLNREVWQGLETLETTFYPSDFDQIWVFAGPIFGEGHPQTITGGVQVPTATYKIIIEHDQEPPTVLAIIMDQNQEGLKHKLSEYVTTVREIEQKTRINFFPQLSQQLQDRIETAPADADRWRTATVLSRNKILKDFDED